MANEIRKFPFLVPPPAKAGSGGGTATESQKQDVQALVSEPNDSLKTDQSVNVEPVSTQAISNVRLVIERNEVSGGYIYKSIDRETGEVIQQFPREAVLRAIAITQAAEGLIIDTEA